MRVRYKFRGHMHYAEIPDYMPVVIPLKGTQHFLTQISCLCPRGGRDGGPKLTLAVFRKQREIQAGLDRSHCG